jgi:ABC-2 type transport system ATP-binding protein
VAAIEARGLARTFPGGITAVAGIDFDVAEGEIYAFLGPNGAGKTTTVRMLTTLLRPTGGTATVAGHDVVHEAHRVRQSIGVALQEAALDPLMTGEELMLLQATLHGLPPAEGRSRSTALLQRVGLSQAASRRVGTYSGGMRRRLDLGMALVHGPKVLFLDEPTTGLDPLSRRAIWDEVRNLNREGTTVFLTTQYLEEADVLANRVGIIATGAMAAEDTPAALKAEVGRPHLELRLAEGDDAQAREVVSRFGDCLHVENGSVAVSLERGVQDVGPIVRALDEAGLMVEELHVVEPTLDDVFLATTGRTLEGADETETETATAASGGDPRDGGSLRSRS